MNLDQRLVREIVERIRSVSTPRRISIFGSAARGTLTRDSDIDVLVLEDQVSDARMARLRIRAALRALAGRSTSS